MIIEGPPLRRFDSRFIIITRFPDVHKANETMLYQAFPDHLNLAFTESQSLPLDSACFVGEWVFKASLPGFKLPPRYLDSFRYMYEKFQCMTS